MDNKEVIETSAQVIEAPTPLAGADKWLSEHRDEVAGVAAEFGAFEIADAAAWRDAKRQRVALRARIAEIEADRKRMTARSRAPSRSSRTARRTCSRR